MKQPKYYSLALVTLTMALTGLSGCKLIKPAVELTSESVQGEYQGYLSRNGFKSFVVSGGGADFMRVWAERVYGIPPE